MQTSQLLIQGKPSEALRAGARILERPDADPDSLVALGVIYGNGKLPMQALDAFQRAAARDDKLFQAQFNYGLALLKVGRATEALAPLARAAELLPQSQEAVMTLGLAAVMNQRYAEAIPPLEQAWKKDSSNGRLGALLATAYLRTHAPAKAIPILKKSSANTNDPAPLFLLVEALAESQQHEEALAAARQAQQRFPKLAQAHMAVAQQLARLGRYQEARPAFEETLKLAPGQNEAELGLADVLQKAGEHEAALEHYRAAGNRSHGPTRYGPKPCRTQTTGRRADHSRAGRTRESIGHSAAAGTVARLCAAGAIRTRRRTDAYHRAASEAIMRFAWLVLLAVAVAAAFAPLAVTFKTARAVLPDIIVSGGAKKNYVLEVNGSGVCWIDYDNDGWLDLYLVNGATLAQVQGKVSQRTTNHLYRNNHDGTFTDVTEKAHVPGRGWGFGCVAADYNNDGNMDLLVTNFGPNILYRNRGDGTFEDVTEKAGVAGGNIWHTGAAFGDYDLDGHLDLYVPGYLEFDAANPELKTCDWRGVKVHACGPLGYKGAPDVLYHNNGDGTFTDVTAKAKVADTKLYFGFQAVFEDFDNDGLPDIFVGNDSNPNYLYKNKGNGTFEEVGLTAGVAFSADGKEMSSMGVAVGDYDHDGKMDIFVTTFSDDNDVLFHNDGDGFFTDVSYPSGIGEPTVPYLGWAAFFLDYDNDGHLDLFCANGHVYPEVDGVIKETFRQPLQMFRNLGNGKFRDTSGETGVRAFRVSARGGAYADYDNDGDLDVAVSIMDAKPLLLENNGGNKGNWLRVKLTGVTCNRMAVGARVKVIAGGITQYAAVRAGESYLSSNDPRLHFGLGTATEADLEVKWPGGKTERFQAVRANQQFDIRQRN